MNLSGNAGTDVFGDDADLFSGDSTVASPIGMPDAGPFGEVFFALAQAFQAIPGDAAGSVPLPFDLGGGANSGATYDRANMLALTGVDFGDNSSPYADDGECDDPRFEGPGAADFNVAEDALTDGNDCSSLYLQGALTFVDIGDTGTDIVVDSSGISFGDNSSIFADDGECDDPRFEGAGSAFSTSQDNAMRDANDCRDLFETGQITLVADADASPPSVSEPSAPAQTTQATASLQQTYTVGVPRGDINGAAQGDGSLFASGTVYGQPINEGDGTRSPMPNTANLVPPPGRSSRSSAIDFGDNTSDYANDGECDDPRFEGDGMAFVSFDEDIARDADDCRAAFEAGTITLIEN